METDRLTQKSQEALHDAQTRALRFGHTEVDGEHLLAALLDQPDGLVPRLIEASAGNATGLRAALEQELGRRPRVSGPGAASGQVFVPRGTSPDGVPRGRARAPRHADPRCRSGPQDLHRPPWPRAGRHVPERRRRPLRVPGRVPARQDRRRARWPGR